MHPTRHHHKLVRITRPKKSTVQNAGEDVEQQGYSLIAGGNAK